jgi:hypothetical protein
LTVPESVPTALQLAQLRVGVLHECGQDALVDIGVRGMDVSDGTVLLNWNGSKWAHVNRVPMGQRSFLLASSAELHLLPPPDRLPGG